LLLYQVFICALVWFARIEKLSWIHRNGRNVDILMLHFDVWSSFIWSIIVLRLLSKTILLSLSFWCGLVLSHLFRVLGSHFLCYETIFYHLVYIFTLSIVIVLDLERFLSQIQFVIQIHCTWMLIFGLSQSSWLVLTLWSPFSICRKIDE